MSSTCQSIIILEKLTIDFVKSPKDFVPRSILYFFGSEGVRNVIYNDMQHSITCKKKTISNIDLYAYYKCKLKCLDGFGHHSPTMSDHSTDKVVRLCWIIYSNF